MMHLTCPHCTTAIPANNINVQEMTAVCPSCNAVFRFNAPDVEAAKIKRRKVKRPDHLTLQENDDHLEMDFRTNFRLDQNGDFISIALLTVMFAALTVILMLSAGSDRAALYPASLAITLFFAYGLGLMVYNRTHIRADETEVRVSRGPLPNLFATERRVHTDDIVKIRCEETEISKKEQYDTPRYRVVAEMVDGSEKLIVNDVIEDYGYFIAAQLQEHVDSHAPEDAPANLIDSSLQPFHEEDEGPASAETLRAHHLTESERRLSGSTVTRR